MHLVSDFLRFKLIDRSQRTATLVDLIMTLGDVDYPPVTHFVFRLGLHTPRVLPWSQVERLDLETGQLMVSDLTASEAIPLDQLEPAAVQLGAAVLDGLILDLQSQRVTRANDLWLEAAGDSLELRAADTSIGAVLHRLSRGRWFGPEPKAACDWKYVEFLRGLPEQVQAGASYHRRVVHLPPGEIASLSQSLPYLHVAELLELLPDQLAADTLESLSAHRRRQVFEELGETKAAKVLALMANDIAADLVGQMDTALARRSLNQLERPAAERLIELLRYPDDSVGGIMTNEVVWVPKDLTVADAREHLRAQLRDPDFVYLVYVVKDAESRQLQGVFSLRDLLLAEPKTPIGSIMNPYVLTLAPLDSARHAANRLLDSQLVAMPVVGDQHRLIGVVTIDAAVTVAAPQGWSAQAPRVFS
jgi:CBS domain-containing protein